MINLKTKFREKDGELYLFTDFFDLKLSRTRNVMVRQHSGNLFNMVDGVMSPSGMSMPEKEAFLLHIAYGLHQKILSDERKNKPEEKDKNDTNNGSDNDVPGDDNKEFDDKSPQYNT